MVQRFARIQIPQLLLRSASMCARSISNAPLEQFVIREALPLSPVNLLKLILVLIPVT